MAVAGRADGHAVNLNDSTGGWHALQCGLKINLKVEYAVESNLVMSMQTRFVRINGFTTGSP